MLHESPPAPSRAARLVPDAVARPRTLEGDLDAIVGKCLRKESEHRYDDVAMLQRDISALPRFAAGQRPRRRSTLCAQSFPSAPSMDGGVCRIHRRCADHRARCCVVASASSCARARHRTPSGRSRRSGSLLRHEDVPRLGSRARHRAHDGQADAGSKRRARAQRIPRRSVSRWQRSSRRSAISTARWKTSKVRCRCSKVS